MLHVLSETDKRLAAEKRARQERLGFKPCVQTFVKPIEKIDISPASVVVVKAENAAQSLDAVGDKTRIEFLLLSMRLPGLDQNKSDVTVSEIIRVVCRYFDKRVVDIKSQRRTQDLVLPRQIIMWLSRELTKSSFPKIARQLGRKDHACIIYGVTKIEHLRQSDHDLQSNIDQLLSALRPTALEESNADGQDQAPA